MKRVIDIIAQFTRVPVEEVKPESNLIEDLGADSLVMLEIIGGIENEFELEEIPSDEADEIDTVQDIIDVVKKYTLSI